VEGICYSTYLQKGDKIYCSCYSGVSLLPTTHKISSNFLLSKLIPCVGEITGHRQCGFQHYRSITNHIFCIRHIVEKKLGYNGTVYQLFMDFEKAYD
jgi:hypothetical protein